MAASVSRHFLWGSTSGRLMSRRGPRLSHVLYFACRCELVTVRVGMRQSGAFAGGKTRRYVCDYRRQNLQALGSARITSRVSKMARRTGRFPQLAHPWGGPRSASFSLISRIVTLGPLVTHRPLPADFSTRTREISRLSGRKPQISNCLHVGGAAHSLPPAWCGSTKCGEHQCPLLGARWSCSFSHGVTTAWKCIRSFCVTTDLR